MNKEQCVINILKKYFSISFDDGDMLVIQAWSDYDCWDTSAYETITEQDEINLLRDVLINDKR